MEVPTMAGGATTTVKVPSLLYEAVP